MHKEWNLLDKIIAIIRYGKIKKYIKNEVIVDIGCGRDGRFLKDHCSQIKFGYGFDFRISDFEFQNLKFMNNKYLKKLPLEDESVDRVFLNAVLEHLDNPVSVLSDAFRILRRGGGDCYDNTY